MLVTSALVVAQVPNAASPPARSRSPTNSDAEGKTGDSKAGRRKHAAAAAEGPRRDASGGGDKGREVIGRPANLENQVQQYMRQARPLVRAELIFVRKVCELDVEHFRRINQDTEAAFKEVATNLSKRSSKGESQRARAGFKTPQAVDGLTLLHEGLAAVMKKDLTPEQFARYQAEVEKRDAYQKQSAVRYLVDAIDRDLYLSDQQRPKLTESLSSHWDQSWSTSLEYLLYGNQFYPAGYRSLCDAVPGRYPEEGMARGPKSGGDRRTFRCVGRLHE